MVKSMKYFAIFGIVVLLASCTPHRRPPLYYDASNPLKRIAVLPMKNDTADVDGPNILRKKMIEALENRSYVVVDVKETDQILRDRMGINLGGQLDLATAQQLGETLGVQGVLYGTLMDFDELTTGAINVKKVRAKFRLVNTATSQALWQAGLGVRSEMRMEGRGGLAGSLVGRAVDARDKEVPWVTIESTTTGTSNYRDSLAIGLTTRFLSQAIGIHLDRESAELARRVTHNLPWGPGAAAAAIAPAPSFAMPDIKMPEPPSFGYMDWEGKRDFTAIIYSLTFDKNKNDTMTMEMPLAVAGNKLRMDMDMSKMTKGDAQSPLSKMVMIQRGDKKTAFTLYPNSQRYTVNADKADPGERPRVEKTKIGTETIDGHPTEKFKVKVTSKNGRVQEGFMWNATDLDGMTIKSEVENKDYRTTMEVKNIMLHSPRATVFEIPAGYTEAKGIMDLMTTEPKNK